MWQNHPVLAAGDNAWALGELVRLSAQPTGGQIRSQDNSLALQVKAYIDYLNRGGNARAEEKPLVEDPLRGREFEVSLREDIAHKYSRVVNRMVKNLAKENGITGVIR